MIRVRAAQRGAGVVLAIGHKNFVKKRTPRLLCAGRPAKSSANTDRDDCRRKFVPMRGISFTFECIE
jgi:hypothetical protein